MIRSDKIAKKTLCFILIFLLTAIFCWSFCNDNIYVGDDLTFHLNRIAGLANAFEERQILPKIYPYANYGFGYATPLFYCDVFLYPFAILYHFGMPAVICFKLMIFVYTLIGDLIVFYCTNLVFKNKRISIIAVILYLFANYHMQNVYLRSALGEVLAITWVPLIIYAFYKIFVLKKDSWVLLGLSFSLLVMSHLISTLLYAIVFFVLIVIYTVVFYKNDKKYIKDMYITIVKGTILALLLCAWYLFPMLEQMGDQTFWLSINKRYNDINSTRQSINNLLQIFSCVDMAMFNSIKNTSVGIMGILLCIIYIFVKKNSFVNSFVVITVVCYLLIFGIMPVLPKIDIIQFLFRFYIIIVPFTVVIGIYSINELGHKCLTLIMLIIISIFCLSNMFLFNRVVSNDGEFYLDNGASINTINNVKSHLYNLDYNHDELGGAEYLPYTELMNYEIEQGHIYTIDKFDAKIEYTDSFSRYFSKIEFEYNDDEDRKILFPLSYYKGYNAYEIVDNELIKIPLYNYELYKMVYINAESGIHTYMVKYEGTKIQSISLLISSMSWLLLFILLVYRRKKYGKDCSISALL